MASDNRAVTAGDGALMSRQLTPTAPRSTDETDRTETPHPASCIRQLTPAAPLRETGETEQDDDALSDIGDAPPPPGANRLHRNKSADPASPDLERIQVALPSSLRRTALASSARPFCVGRRARPRRLMGGRPVPG